jgi:hypothetical protein
MQTVEVFAKPGCSREPRKIPNESPFFAEFRGIYTVCKELGIIYDKLKSYILYNVVQRLYKIIIFVQQGRLFEI